MTQRSSVQSMSDAAARSRVCRMTPEEFADAVRLALEADYPESLTETARAWIDSMYLAHGDLYVSRLEHAFAEEFLRRCGLNDGEIAHTLGGLHP